MTTHYYTFWLANNFNQYINTNPFANEYQDDIELIINDYEEFEPIKEESLYNPNEFYDHDYYHDEHDLDDDEYTIMNDWLLD